LQRVALFQKFTPSELSEILELGHMRRIEEGGFFFHQGDQADHIYVLTDGRVHLGQVTPDGQQIILRVITPGRMFGAVGVAIPGSVCPAAAQAIEDSQGIAWESATFRRLGEKNPSLAFDMMGMMNAYVQEIQDRFRELATERTEQRLARTILRLAAQAGRRVNEGVLIDMAITRQDLAQMTGTTLFTVSRLLSDWERRGLIETGRERVSILQPHGLVRIAEDLVK
jgi:CRP-like cAMP-binding protein